MNAVLPPIVAALRLPFTLALGFLAVLALDAGILLLVSAIDPNDFQVDSFGSALGAALVMSAASLVLHVILGVNDDDVLFAARDPSRRGAAGERIPHRRPRADLP